MFYLIRSKATKEVLGILSVNEVLDDFDVVDYVDIKEQLITVVEANISLKYNRWYFQYITQAEYETYRDLHGFRVLIKPDTDLGYS